MPGSPGEKLQKRRTRLASARQQPDDAGEAERLKQEIDSLEAELQQLRVS